MQHPDSIINSRRSLPRGLAAGLLFTQLALVSFGQATPAASADPDADKTVVLEKLTVQAGFAGSLAASAEKKQEAVSITEVISTEDLGKLPDISIADSLTRLPGLAAQRTNGRAQQISVRGLNGDFSTATLNGREQVSTNLNRAVEFDQYPADLLDTVTVYKTASANLPSQGIAGTIDMQTVSPLSKTGRKLALNAYYQWNDLGELTPGVDDKGYRTGLAYVDQFNDGKVGIALGVSLASSPWAGKQFQAWGYPTEAGGAFVLGGTKSYVRNSVLDRNAFMGVLEFRPSDNLHLKFDIYAADFEEKQLLRGMEIPLWWSSASIQPGYTTNDGLVTNSTFGNVMPVVRNDVFKRTDSPLALGANAVFGEKSAWPVTLDLGYSRIERKDQNLESWSGISFRGTPFTTADTMNVKLIPGEIPVITPTKNYADSSTLRLSDPQGWGPTTIIGGGMHGYLKYFQSKDEMGQFKAFTKHDLKKWWFHSVELGGSYTDRYKRDGEGPSGYISPANGANTLPLPPTVGTTDMGFLGVGGIYAYDPLAANESGIWAFTPNNDSGIVANRYEIREKVTQLYGMLNLDTKWGSLPVSGNIGLRAIYADQSSDGRSANGATLTPVSGGDQYWDFAPNLNLNFKPGQDFVVRFSVANQIARPRMYDMRASRTWSYSPANAGSSNIAQSPWSGSGGNPALRPWESLSFDLSIEKYFAEKRGYFALAGFTKDLKNYIYEQQSVADFTGYPITGPEPVLRQGIVTQPVNGDGGHLNGVEITLSVSSELFNRDIKGFGLIMSGAYTDSSIKPWGPTNASAPIAGLSDKVAGFTAYYERHGFSIRLSDRYRSENRQYITTFGVPSPGGDVNPNGGFSVAQPENVIDAQISYTFLRGPMKGVTFLVQGYNLNDEPLVTYDNNDPRKVINYQTYGASYSVGVSYKF